MRYAAKLTHRIYGRRSHAAGFDIFAKTVIVARIASQRKIISTKAASGDCDPKKMIDQSIFKASCPMNMLRAILTSFRSRPFFHTRKAAMPIRAKSVVQTGPNIQLGGLRAGLVSVAYQPAIDGAVNREPMMPASSDIMMATMSLRVLFMR